MRQPNKITLGSPEVKLRAKLKEAEKEISKLKDGYEKILKEIDKFRLNEVYARTLIHELKNINRDLKFDTDDLDFDKMTPEEKNLWSQSNLLSIVMNTYGYQYNQEVDKSVFKRQIPLYKKVDKLRRCYNYRRNSDFNIQISGKSTKSFHSSDIVEVLFFILIENARKYSLKKERLYIDFNEYDSIIEISFKNKCILPANDEIPHLTELNYRGINKTNEGNGIGLFTFASICQSNGIEYEISTEEDAYSFNKEPIGYFIVSLRFKDCR